MSETLTFVVTCPWCGERLDAIPVGPDGRWSEMACWGYLAQRAHDPVCPKLKM